MGAPVSRGETTESLAPTAPESTQPPQPWKALCLLARLHHIAADPESLVHARGLSPSVPATDDELLGAAK
ncbi:MAG: hypothetical protein HYX44_13485, partial [Aquabacterium sp.]|nr:hypothetical protein [Aquabacterium sp.]